MIDRERIAELEGEIGPDDVLLIAEAYFSEAEQAIAGLRDAADGDARARQMHFLRSGALNIGFRGMAEAAAAAGADPDAPRQLRAVLERTRIALLPPRTGAAG